MADHDTEKMDGEKKSGGSTKLILMIVIPIILLLLIGAGLYFSGVLNVLIGKKEEAHAEAPPPPPPPKESVFMDLPEMLVNLNTGGKKANFLKLSVSLQIESKEDQDKITKVQPRVLDAYQTYLRELRLEDLRGSGGPFRVKEELLLRINAAVAPVKVEDVLLKEILVQ